MTLKLATTPNKDYKRIVGIDSSTTGVAWTLFYAGKPQKWGKIDTSKIKGINDKLAYIAVELPKVLKAAKPDHIFVEKSIYMRSVTTMRVLSYVVGAIMITAISNGYEITDIEPMVAKSFYSYNTLSRKFTQQAALKLGKANGKKLCERLRKEQIQRVNSHNFPKFDGWTDHDISDSCAIAAYGYDKLVKPLKLEKSKEVALDMQELATLGLGGFI